MNKLNFDRNRIITFSLLLFSLILIPFPASAEEFSLDWPVNGQIITDYQSTYVSQTTGEECTHSGIDIEADAGSAIEAAADGVVVFAGFTPSGGSDSSTKNTVSIEHPNGLRTTYLQLRDVVVSRGQNVVRGQLIAKVAVTGDPSSALPHLHFGLKQGERYLDPKIYLTAVAEGPSDGGNSNDPPDQPDDSQNPLPLDQTPQVLSIPEEIPVFAVPETLSPEQPDNRSEPVGSGVPISSPNDVSVAVTAKPAVSPQSDAGSFSALPESQTQASLKIKQEYLSSSAVEEKALSLSGGLIEGPTEDSRSRLLTSKFIIAAVLAAILLALIQSAYPAFSRKTSDLTAVGSHFFSYLFMKGG